MKVRSKKAPAGSLPIAPMIDVVFLLLIYFMVSSTLQKQEADLRFSLPAQVQSKQPIRFGDQTVIVIDAEGRPSVNGYAYDAPGSRRFDRLAAMLNRYREASEAAQGRAAVVIAPDDRAPHQMVVKVLDACQWAGVKAVSFAVE